MVTMNLPEAVLNMRKAQIVSDVTSPEEAATIDDDYFAPEVLEEFTEERDKDDDEPIRNYSIDLWNGSPGLAHWGYVSKDHWDADRK